MKEVLCQLIKTTVETHSESNKMCETNGEAAGCQKHECNSVSYKVSRDCDGVTEKMLCLPRSVIQSHLCVSDQVRNDQRCVCISSLNQTHAGFIRLMQTLPVTNIILSVKHSESQIQLSK